MSDKKSKHSHFTHADTEKCLFSFRVINRVNNLSCCLTCFCDTDLISRVQSFEIFITHHIANGPYTPWDCVFCHRDNVQSRPIAFCRICTHAYTTQLIKLRNSGINLPNTQFLFNVFTNKFEYLGAALTRNDRS